LAATAARTSCLNAVSLILPPSRRSIARRCTNWRNGPRHDHLDRTTARHRHPRTSAGRTWRRQRRARREPAGFRTRPPATGTRLRWSAARSWRPRRQPGLRPGPQPSFRRWQQAHGCGGLRNFQRTQWRHARCGWHRALSAVSRPRRRQPHRSRIRRLAAPAHQAWRPKTR